MPTRRHAPTTRRSLSTLVATSVLATAAVQLAVASDARATTSTVTTTATAVADTVVREDLPTSAFGSAALLRADAKPRSESYLRFNVAGHTGTVTKATLKVYSHSDSDHGFTARAVTSAWTEAGTTWATKPTTGAIVASTGATRENAWASLDVTSLVRGDGTVDIALTSGSIYERLMAAREAGSTKAAHLVVESVVTATPTAAPTTAPTTAPTAAPTTAPTAAPTTAPTTDPTAAPAPSVTPVPAATPVVPSASAPLHVSPGGAGTRDGSSWSNAGDLADIPRFISTRPNGGEIRVRGDAGAYRHTSSININSGGSASSPVVIRGVDSSGAATVRPLVVGTRTAPYSPTGADGGEVFKLYSGAKNLVFSNLAFENEGTVFNAGGNASNITVSDVTATNVRRFFSNYLSSGETTANISGLTLRRIKVDGFSKAVLRLDNDSNNVLMEDVVGDSQRQDKDNFAMGVHLGGTVHAVTLRRVTMNNAHDSVNTYWNGDGFATERGAYDIRFEDTSAAGNTDGGYDLKSTKTVLVNARAEDNKRNFRFWAADTTVLGCAGLDPLKRGGTGTQAQVWLGAYAKVTLDDCTLQDTSAGTVAFELENGASLRATDTTVSISPLALLQRLGSGASLDIS